MRKSISILIAVLLLVPLICVAGDVDVVKRVIDGDTFELENGNVVRLIGVDAPESSEQLGREAAEFTQGMLTGKSVRLEYDREERDLYQRVLAYAFLGETFVNAELIKQGYARAYTKYPFRQEYVELFTRLEKEAREAGKGLWAKEATSPQPTEEKYWLNTSSGVLHNSSCRWYGKTKEGYYTTEPLGRDCSICGGAHRQTSAQEVKTAGPDDDVTVYVTRTGTKYHRWGCRYLRKSAIPMKLSEARKIYSPCSVCKPPR
jgi:micrococcal nuclease